MSNDIKKVLTIAGSDCSGGAGIQADLKTMLANGCYGMSVITALTAQNTVGVFDILECNVDFVKNQIDSIFSDIVPDAIKIGMVASKEIINCISENLKKYNGKNIVVDPVMVSTSKSRLLKEDAINELINNLIPIAKVITPNIYEAEILANMEVKDKKDMVKAAAKISKNYNGYILIKGGHLVSSADDLLYYQNNETWFKESRVDNENTHGTGCTLSSAIASFLAKGDSVEVSIKKAKEYITGALKCNFNIGKGSGPLNHGYVLNR